MNRFGNKIHQYMAGQLANPRGWFGRIYMSRWLNKANRTMNALTLKMLDIQAGEHILEIGFGGGDLLLQMLHHAGRPQLNGIDVSDDMVRHTRRRLSAFIPSDRLALYQGQVEKMPFDDARFDRICSVNTIYFWANMERALQECRRALRNDGMLVLCFNDPEELKKWPGHVHGFRLMGVIELQVLLRNAGFDKIRLRSEQDPRQGLFHCLSAHKC